MENRFFVGGAAKGAEIMVRGVCGGGGYEGGAGMPCQTHSTDVGVVMPCQTHSTNVGVVADVGEGQRFDDTDALITRVPGVWIGVRTADCVPVCLYAPDIAAVAAIHAGWKGTLHRIVEVAVGRLTAMGASAERMYAFVGPAICGDCYEVSGDLGDIFAAAGFGQCISTGITGIKPHIDLKECNRQIMLACGIKASNITVSDICTRHTFSDEMGLYPFYSYRRNIGETGRNITAIRLIADAPSL